MRILLIVTILSVFLFASCGSKVKCTNLGWINLNIEYGYPDTAYFKQMPYTIEKYSKGSNFTDLIAHEDDTIFYANPDNRSKQLAIDYDWLITVPARNKTVKIENIYAGEQKSVKNPFTMSGGGCSAKKCTNTLYYTVNGEELSGGGGSGCADDYTARVDVDIKR